MTAMEMLEVNNDVKKRIGSESSTSNLRLETIVLIRWLAVAGQVSAVFFVAFVLGYEFYLSLCLALIAASAWLNLFLRMRYRASFRLTENAAMALLGYDILQLSLLLFLTGGMQNPFALLLIVPVVVSATTQSFWQFVPLGILAVSCATLLIFFHLPLPWTPGETLRLPLIYVVGNWVAVTSTLAFTAIYAYRVADEARKLSDALAATELVLQREQHLTTLDGLAAAAAHELGTPLATIALVSKEMQRELPPDSPLCEDAQLLRGQAERCRQILQKLSSLTEEGEHHIGTLALSSLMEQVAAPHRNFGILINVEPGSIAGEPIVIRNPAIVYGLGNLIENAVDFAEKEVTFAAWWDDETILVSLVDDGPGFSADVLERIGEPYVTSRRRFSPPKGGGLGLGLFIAQTLLQRSGAVVEFTNIQEPGRHGAKITIAWPRSQIDIAYREAGETEPSTLTIADTEAV
jgi:two-component system, sensor histidine kinase RegB